MKNNSTNKTDETIQIDLSFESISDAMFCITSLGAFLTMFKDRVTDSSELSGNEVSDLSENLYQVGNLIKQISDGVMFAVEDLIDEKPVGNVINLPISKSKSSIKPILKQLKIDAPLPPLKDINQINLQISLKPEVE